VETVTIWSSLDQYVRVESRDDAGDPSAVPNEHPVELAPDELGSFLGAVLARRESSGEAASVFAPDQLEVLTRELPEAFRRAGPAQDVTFAVLGAKRVAFGIGTGPTLATGRMFVQAGRLNLIFGDVHRRVDLYSGRPVDPFVPGSRQPRSSGKQDFELEASPEGKQAIELVRSDWVRGDVGGPAAAPAQAETPPRSHASPAAAAASEQPAAPVVEREAPTPETAPAVKVPARHSEEEPPTRPRAQPAPPASSPKASPAPASPAAAPAGSTAPPTRSPAVPEAASQPVSPPPPPPPASPKARQELEAVQERLWVLEELRRKGLVTEEEYRASRARILEGL